MRTFNFTFTVTCSGSGEADLERVEELVDMNMQDLLMEDLFIDALDEKEAVTIQVNLVK